MIIVILNNLLLHKEPKKKVKWLVSVALSPCRLGPPNVENLARNVLGDEAIVLIPVHLAIELIIGR